MMWIICLFLSDLSDASALINCTSYFLVSAVTDFKSKPTLYLLLTNLQDLKGRSSTPNQNEIFTAITFDQLQTNRAFCV